MGDLLRPINSLEEWQEQERMRQLFAESRLLWGQQEFQKTQAALRDPEWRDRRWTDQEWLWAGEMEALYETVKRLARRMGTHLPTGVSVEDLEQEGHVALLQALQRYDHLRSRDLPAFCLPRIKGAMVDYLRRHTPLSQKDQTQAKAMAGAYGRLQQALGRVPSTNEVARELQVTGTALQGLLARLTLATVASLQAVFGGGEPADRREGADPAEQAVRQDHADRLHRGMGLLPPRERLLLYLHYFEDVSLTEVGEMLGMNASSASELHRTVLARMLGFFETGILHAPQRGRPFI